MGLQSYTLLLAGLIVFGACSNRENEFDATGNFEADEVIVSAEGAGKIMALAIEEGQELKKGEIIGYIDTLQLYLRKKQLQSSAKAVMAKQPNVAAQLATIQEQIEATEKEKARFERLLQDDAATQKQVDDLAAHLALLQKQYKALQSSLAITTRSLSSEVAPIAAQVDQVNDQIRKSIIVNPLDGTVLVKYAQGDEVTAPGKALYKIADLSYITLRAYISGNQLPTLKLGQKVTVMVDDLGPAQKKYEGVVSWIADKAEFTPKTIQTKEERANLVYAIKVRVKNDGYLKIGMYGELTF